MDDFELLLQAISPYRSVGDVRVYNICHIIGLLELMGIYSYYTADSDLQHYYDVNFDVVVEMMNARVMEYWRKWPGYRPSDSAIAEFAERFNVKDVILNDLS